MPLVTSAFLTAFPVTATHMGLKLRSVTITQEFAYARKILKAQDVMFAVVDHFILTLQTPRDASDVSVSEQLIFASRPINIGKSL